MAKYWSFSFSISPFNEYSGLVSFRIDWFDLAVQETLKSLLQHHSPKASILQHSAFFMVQLTSMNFLWGSGGKESAYNVGDLGLIHGLGISPRERKGYLLQYSGLENVMDLYSPWGHKESGMTE